MNDAKAAVNPAVSPQIRRAYMHVPADMTLYAALVGKTPEIDPTLAEPMNAAIEARREQPWSPIALSAYLREVCREKALKINKPELAAWLRKQSTIARKRFRETQTRVIAAGQRAA